MAYDRHPEEFRRLVVLGESHVQGGRWLLKDSERWPDILVELINRCQSRTVEYFNKGVGASVISPRSPEYAASGKPSALERYRRDVIALSPDLFILSYGLNDMRAGMDPLMFMEDMERIIVDVKSACSPLIVLTTVYYYNAYGLYPPFDKGNPRAARVYNTAIRGLAHRHGCLVADIWEAENEADWLIHPDGVHANFVGQLVIACRIFETLAGNCGGLSKRIRERDRLGYR